MKRIEKKFQELKNQCAFIGYICAGDPDFTTSLNILKAMPKAGVDIIELGVPFLDPSGDGPIIEMASKRAIQAGMSLSKTFLMAQEFRKNNQETPLILMSYYNVLLKYGIDKIFLDAEKSGIDGVLIVDLPMEEESEILTELKKSQLDLIRLIAPSTDEKRAKQILQSASGFVYLISMLGITGTKMANAESNKNNLAMLKKITNLPVAIGFGIQSPSQAGEFSKIGVDGVVIGSTIVKEIGENFLAKKSADEIVLAVTKKINEFSQQIK